MQDERYLVLRVPSAGPPAVIAEPYDFATHAEAQARIDEIEANHLVVHHTYLEIMSYAGDRFRAMDAAGVIY
ncbi:MAG: hypothetical protein AAF557_02265 [Pseudomonadota bacterium]